MGLTRTAAELKADALERADQSVGAFRAGSRVYRYLSESCRSLISVLVNDYEETYWGQREAVYASNGQQATDVPEGAWKLIMLRTTLAGERIKIGRASLADIDMEATSVGGWLACKPRFRVMGRAFQWVPIPRATHTIDVYYVPTAIFFDANENPKTQLTADTDYFDGIDGWEQWVVLDTAIKLRNDEGKESSALQREKEERFAEITSSASERFESEPAQVQDTWRRE